jgi:thymidylate kinase
VSTARAVLPALAACTALARALHTGDFRYCHWKSNEHLRASMLGKTDLDVLVDRRDVRRLAPLLAELDFKRLQGAAWRSYPAVESYLGMDAETGTLIHLHLHCRLTLGERELKGYRIPWEERLLSTRRLNETEGVYISDPALELILLAIRAALKVRTRDRLLERVGRTYVGQNLKREWEWLGARVDPEQLRLLGHELIGARATDMLLPVIAAPPPRIGFLDAFARAIVPALEEYRSYAPAGARVRRWSREARRVLAERARRWLAMPVGRRVLPDGGVLIAFVGIDGSGKSTLARELARWLSPFVDVVPIYFGTGEGPKSISRGTVEAFARLVRRAPRPPLVAADSATASAETAPRAWRGSGTSRLRTMGELLWVWTVARERTERATRARRARDRGMVVVCDRFPQSGTPGNDGPCLGHWLEATAYLRRSVARRELAAIQTAERLRPDLLVKLTLDPEVALARKPESRPELVFRKARIVADFHLSDETRTVEVDAARSFPAVLHDVRRAVWELL